jgi:hypothetical protein
MDVREGSLQDLLCGPGQALVSLHKRVVAVASLRQWNEHDD